MYFNKFLLQMVLRIRSTRLIYVNLGLYFYLALNVIMVFQYADSHEILSPSSLSSPSLSSRHAATLQLVNYHSSLQVNFMANSQ